MSWQSYVDTNLVGSGQITAAGIYDLVGNPWAYSAGFAAQVAEVAAVAAAMLADPTVLAGTGVMCAGQKYMFVRGDSEEVYAKKGSTGVAFFKCKSCIIVCYHDDKIQPGQCCSTAGKLATYMIDNNM